MHIGMHNYVQKSVYAFVREIKGKLLQNTSKRYEKEVASNFRGRRRYAHLIVILSLDQNIFEPALMYARLYVYIHACIQVGMYLYAAI